MCRSLAVCLGLLLVGGLLATCGGDGQESELATHPGRTVFVDQGCGACHTLKAAGADGDVGPNLDEALDGKGRDSVRRSILAPQAEVEQGFPDVMPRSYEERLSRRDLDQLVDFIVRAAGS